MKFVSNKNTGETAVIFNTAGKEFYLTISRMTFSEIQNPITRFFSYSITPSISDDWYFTLLDGFTDSLGNSYVRGPSVALENYWYRHICRQFPGYSDSYKKRMAKDVINLIRNFTWGVNSCQLDLGKGIFFTEDVFRL